MLDSHLLHVGIGRGGGYGAAHGCEELDRSVYRVSPDYPIRPNALEKGGTSAIGLFISLVRARNSRPTTLPYPITWPTGKKAFVAC